MKKLLLTLTAIVALSVAASAQISLGVKGGLNLAKATGDDADGTDGRTSFHFGAYLTLDVSEKFSIQPELLYNSVGAKNKSTDFDPDFGDITTEETYKLNYISVPVMFLYKITPQFNIQAGPQFSFLASAKDKYEISYDGGSTSGDEDIKDQFKGLDLGFNVGLGANFGKLNASARYCLGLSNIADAEDADLKNSVIQVSLGYRLFGGE